MRGFPNFLEKKIQDLSEPFSFLIRFPEFSVEVKPIFVFGQDVFKTVAVLSPPFWESYDFLMKGHKKNEIDVNYLKSFWNIK